MTPVDGHVRVHALIDDLGVGGAQMVLAEFAAVAASGGVDLSVGYLSDVIDGAHGVARLHARGVEPRLVGIPRRLGPAAFLAVRRHLAQVRPEIVHTHLGAADLLGGPAARSLRIPAVTTMHSHAWPGDRREQVKTRGMRLARRVGARRVVAVSESAREAYLALGGERPERIVVIRNGIADAPQPGAGRGIREQYGLGDESLVVAMVSSLRAVKGHEIAIAAIAQLKVTLPEVRLLIVGDGPVRASITRAAEAVGADVVFTGYRPDVMAVLDAADVLLHPSHHDALPTSIIEAMAASTPVVATRVGGIPELVEDGVSAMLVPAPPNASEVAAVVGDLLRDPDRRGRLAAESRKRFERELTADRWAVRMGQLYRSVLSPR